MRERLGWQTVVGGYDKRAQYGGPLPTEKRLYRHRLKMRREHFSCLSLFSEVGRREKPGEKQAISMAAHSSKTFLARMAFRKYE
jgi:hypothetical protein